MSNDMEDEQAKGSLNLRLEHIYSEEPGKSRLN